MKPPCCIGFAYVWFGLCYVWICFSFDANSLYLVSLLFGRRSGPVLPSACIVALYRYQPCPSAWATCFYTSLGVHVSSFYCIEGLVSPYVFYHLRNCESIWHLLYEQSFIFWSIPTCRHHLTLSIYPCIYLFISSLSSIWDQNSLDIPPYERDGIVLPQCDC